ncbi:MAG TPA: TRAP transporter TatT component family protein [Myxococcales bacterium]|nr:TRAP transporter TatT component family protein [Myxococcales bacterium]
MRLAAALASLALAQAASHDQALLASAREMRARIAREELDPAADAKSLAALAESCAADAHASWAGQFPEAATAKDRAKSLSSIGPAGAEALYLEAVCTAAAARMQGFTPLIERRQELIDSFTRVSQLAPDLDGSGPDRELGALYASLPAQAGGDLEEARKHLLAALTRSPDDPRNHLVLARTVAVKAQDKALFHEHLTIAASSSDATTASQASALLQREEDLFTAGP